MNMNELALRAPVSAGPEHDGRGTYAPGHNRPSRRRPTGDTSGGVLAVIGAASVGAAISLSLGMYGRFHTPTGVTIDPVRPQDLLTVKSWLATVGAALALFQLLSALRLYGRIPSGRAVRSGPPPRWLAPMHRWSGTLAFVATLPVAYHCLWSLGFQTTTARVLIHSALGCAFYGAFATKLLALRSSRMPGWALPVLGGLVFTVLVAIWFSSALWYFTGSL